MDSTEKPDIKIRHAFSILFLISAAVLLFLFCSREVYESDTFLHLKTGQLIVEQRGIPRTDPFSYANAGKPWINHETLSQVIFYFLYSLGGPGALVVYCALLVLICFGFAVLSGADLKYPFSLFGLLLLAIITASERYQIRPEVHTMAMLGIFLFILERYRKVSGSRLIWLLPPLQVLWENLHGGTLLGIALTGAYLAGEGTGIITNKFLGWPAEAMNKNKYKSLAIVFLLVVLACFVNPWGPMTFLLASKLKAHSYAMSSIMEWQRTYKLFGQFNPLPIRIYPWLLGITGLSFIINYRRLNLSRLFIFLGLLALSLLARRNIALFAVAAVPFSARNLVDVWESRGARVFKEMAGVRPWLMRVKALSWITAGLCVLVLSGWLMRELVTDQYNIKNRYFFRFGYGQSSTINPWGLFDFMDKVKIDGPGFNNHDLGCYLIWREFPRHKAFLDCRSAIYDQEFLDEYQDAVNSASGFRILTAKYRFSFAAILHATGDGENLAGILYQDPGWAPVYLDQATALFLRDSPGNRGLIKRHGLNLAEGDGPVFSVKNPSAFDYAGAADFFRAAGLNERSEEYLTMAVAESPDHPVIRDNLAKIKLLLGKYSEAIAMARKALELEPGFAEAHMTIANAYYYLGQFEDSINACDRAIGVARKNADAYSNRGAALLALDRNTEALKSFDRALNIDPDHNLARFNRALTLERMDDPRARSAWQEYIFQIKRTGASLQAIREAEAHLSEIESK